VLTEESYLTAIYAYCVAAALICVLLEWWLWRGWRNIWVALAVTLSAALLLTPAFPQPGVDTMAPALIVAGFELLLNGPEAAEHAFKPVAVACGLALVLAILLRLTLLKPRRPAPATGEKPEKES